MSDQTTDILTIAVDASGGTSIKSAEKVDAEKMVLALAMTVVAVMEICDRLIAVAGGTPVDAALLKQQVMTVAENILRGGVDASDLEAGAEEKVDAGPEAAD